MSALDDVPLSSADRLVSRYRRRYQFGRRLLLVSKIIQILGWILISYFVIQLLIVMFSTGNVLAVFQLFFSAPIFFLESGAMLWLVSFLIEGFVYLLFSVLDIAVNGSTELTEEQKTEMKALANR